MGLLDRFRKKRPQVGDQGWPSIVFLLREPDLPSSDEAMQLTRNAWGAAGPVELLGEIRRPNFLLRASELKFALHAASVRYEVDGAGLPAAYQPYWDQHTAWLAVDLPGHRTDELRKAGTLASAYGSLMFFANKYWSPNCLTLYFPDEGVTIPNQGDLIQSIRWSATNGADLRFLQKSKV